MHKSFIIIIIVLYCLTNNYSKIILIILEFYFGKQNSQNYTNLQIQNNITVKENGHLCYWTFTPLNQFFIRE